MSVNYHKLNPEKVEFVSVAEVGDLPNGERIFLEIDDYNIVVFNIAGQYFAIADICSHDDGPLGDGELDADELTVACPRHGATFDICSGKALTLPAVVDIPAYPVRIVNGQIEVGVPLE